MSILLRFHIETTVAGAAFLAGLATGVYGGLDDLAKLWREERSFEPAMKAGERDELRRGWAEALARSGSKVPA